MNISDVTVRLTEKDILSIISDYLKIDEIKITEISISDFIKIQGNFIKGIKLNFIANLMIIAIENNKLKLKLLNLKVGILPIAIKLLGFILKKPLLKLTNMGITFEAGNILVDFNLLCKYIPFVEFYLTHITMLKGGLEVELRNLSYTESKQALSLNELKEKIGDSSHESIQKDEKIGDSSQIIDIKEKQNEGYYKFRKETINKIPNKYHNIAEIIMILPDITILLYRLMKDNRVSMKTKVMIGTVITYLALPYDVIPDFIPILGKSDDLGIGLILLERIIEDIPKEVILDNWQGSSEIIKKVGEVGENIEKTIGRKNAIRILFGAAIFIKKRKKKR
ncbi:hypothetical protein CLHOM_21750 [Clostridium homopropionicum DSM 5847]|uniref:DUF1232 domain-containing protein n=1 Tax=Clostridium homopropionicum DSM 5847 TaxID=1121318 RepID=A0A0L6Z8T8_9CLOT|nr:DUF1232 domain-containing protein [Clostridium homopropionicum]KOA19384.1 hypothetical protein CLHOM_21750 [Clostridium homopropionicum DSM 5847]SFG68124.1 Uncharacterized membrane protein YkvA, DUF1232 family [Clostridium homopropionicum]